MKRFACCFRQRGQQSDSDEEENRSPRGSASIVSQAGPSVPFPVFQTTLADVMNRESLMNLGGETFTFAEIQAATENYNRSNLLGEGGFGEVYRGYMERLNKVVAVKVHDQLGRQGHGEFAAEVKLLQRANHPNLIKFLGHCVYSLERVIVYDFMPLGSLDLHLFGEKPPLDWATRMKIAVGTARGLEYVHKTMKVIHRDIKAENVLLDNGFVPKIADFGLAVEAPEDDGGPPRATTIVGTPGYIAPEYETTGLLSFGCDIYSYGVLLIQLLTGRKAYDLGRPREKHRLVNWVRDVWDSEENLPLIADPKLGRKFPVEGLMRAFMAARLCVHPNASTRPDMDMVDSLVSEAAAFPIDPALAGIEEGRRTI